MMNLQSITPPSGPLATLAEAKSYLRISDTQDDAEIASLIQALSDRAESWTGRAFLTQTWALWLDRVPGELINASRVLALPRPPLVSVTHVKTYDPAGSATTLNPSNYFVDAVAEPGRVVFNQEYSWPGSLRSVRAVEVQYVAGYGDATAVPAAIREGLLLWLKVLFAGRTKLLESDESSNGLVDLHKMEMPPQTLSLWKPYQLMRL
ncbi:MAG: hypothetical protein G3M78_03935 [Candidatus Nitrohelix vancouverensis]|uniref:Phage gp6-like head-tail connector protein n=1 Tax=Candidatus Nitrohelix vancouverensis TaxID=2705534 RepID=A0A7T0G2Q6_9BACT|nr:MAG: hypothetical protein G3M78_03935 [Candidatus Nitrohelix vancouverensis]